MLFLLISFLTYSAYGFNVGCGECLSNGFAFSCGITVNMGGCTYVCCNTYWVQCGRYCNPVGCRCPGSLDFNATVIVPINKSQYDLTEDKRLFTQYVTTAVQVDDKVRPGQIKHSSELRVGDLVMWPGHDLGTGDLGSHVVMTVGHHNVSRSQAKCCASISIGFPPSCHVKFCCGNGCCC